MTSKTSISEDAVEIRDLEYSYDGIHPVIRIPQLFIKRGERVFIYGPSGSGKTTLLGLLAGVLETKKGVIRILGTETSRLSSSQRDEFRGNHIGYIFQMFNLIPYLDVENNIKLACDLNSKRRKAFSSKAAFHAAAELLGKDLGIQDIFKKKVTLLSVGQQQRVAVARALMGSPEIIIADEPTSALDYDHREKFLNLLFMECSKSDSTVLFVSHDRTLEKLFDRSVSLKEINKV